jgi:LuxR family transcriptional regulator, maltose regulon positive regulatory protein
VKGRGGASIGDEPRQRPVGERKQPVQSLTLITNKLHAPIVRDQAIPRGHLLERLNNGSGLKLTLVACPAGYGKSSLLAEWREAEVARRPVAWVSLHERDDDPVRLWSYAIAALRNACPAIGPSVGLKNAHPEDLIEIALPRLLNELDSQGEIALVLDDFHRLSSGPASESVAWFIENAPRSFQLVIATRTEPALRLAALRAHGELLELRADDLRFSLDEAEAFLNGRLGLGLDSDDVATLVSKTAGWPAGLYLAALSLQHFSDKHAYVEDFSASSRHILDFLLAEVLERENPATQTLMSRSSILERLSGPLCAAVTGEADSTEMLAGLAATNLFLTPLDDKGDWYRFHSLFRELLSIQLERHEPGLVATLHRRAYEWHRDHEDLEEAIEHALDAEAFHEAAELIESSWIWFYSHYRQFTVLAWLRRLPAELVDNDAVLLLTKAWMLALARRWEESAQVLSAAEQRAGDHQGRLPGGLSSVEAGVALLRAASPSGDVGALTAQSLRTVTLEGPTSPWRAVASWAVGRGLYFSGEPEEAEDWFEEAATLAAETGHVIMQASALSYRSKIAGDADRLDEQELFAKQAMDVLRAEGIDEEAGTILAAHAAALGAHQMFEEALVSFERALFLARRRQEPLDLADTLLRQARLLRRLGDHERAAASIVEARSVVDSCRDPGVLTEWLTALDESPRVAFPGDPEVSHSERRVLRLMSTQLTVREIGAELYLSRNTVHSHTRSIYRKLGVTSRADAVSRARERGLL